jgi:hypothetical protein
MAIARTKSRVLTVSAVGALATVFAPSLIGPSQVGAKVPVLSVFEQTHCPKVCRGKDPRGKYVIRTEFGMEVDEPIDGGNFIQGGSIGTVISVKYRRSKYGAIIPDKTLRDEKFPRCTPKGSEVTVSRSNDTGYYEVIGTTTTDSNGNWSVPGKGFFIGTTSVRIEGHRIKYRGKRVRCRDGGNSSVAVSQ